MRAAAMSITVFRIRLTNKEELRKNCFNTDTIKKPIKKLKSNTFTSLSSIAPKVFTSGSLYFSDRFPDNNRVKKSIRSARVQQMAITNIMGSFRLFTIEPLGTMSFEIGIIGEDV